MISPRESTTKYTKPDVESDGLHKAYKESPKFARVLFVFFATYAGNFIDDIE